MSLPNTADYLPKALRDLPLNARVSLLMDYVKKVHHDDINSRVEGMWNPSSDGYDSERILQELDGVDYITFLQDATVRTTVSQVLTGMYRMKGTDRALKLILNIMGIRGEIVDYFKVQRQILLDNDQGRLWSSDPDYSSLKPCEVIVKVQLDGDTVFDTNNTSILAELFPLYMWSCTRLAALLVLVRVTDKTFPQLGTTQVSYEDNVNISDPMATGLIKYGVGGKTYGGAGLYYGPDGGGRVGAGMRDRITISNR